MHKKRIKGKPYFYTSYRDETGKIRTKYLGSNERTARKREAEFKGIPQRINWKPFLILLFFIAGILLIQNYLMPVYLGASIFGDYQIFANPSASGMGIYNATAYFNTSIFGYGNYTDADLDDSNGTSTYKWFVNGVVNATGNTSQLLLCHFNNNYTCEEGETANITQYHIEFNNTLEQINITLNETNSTLVYFNVPKLAIITEAYMNISGYLTSDDDELQYDSLANASYGVGGSPPGQDESGSWGYKMAGIKDEKGINSWFLINNTPTGYVANILSIRYGDTFGTPSNGNFSYNIKICPTDLVSLSSSTQTNEPDGNCTSSYIDLIDTVNLSSNFTDTSGGWQNFTFNDNTSITFDQDTNYILKFEFVDGDLSTDRWWEMYVFDVDHPNKQTYIAYNDSSPYISGSGNQNLQFYFKSRYPKGVEIDIGNDGDNEFADSNESFDTMNTTADFTSEINDYLSSSCSDTYCDIPINVSSNSSGIIGLEFLRISYDHYDLDGKFSEGMIANYTFITKYESDNNIHNHNGTLDIWVKPYWDGDDDNEYTFFTDSDDIIQLNKSAANNLVFFVKGNTESTLSCAISTWTAREQYLITATWNEGEDVYLYINGSSCDSGSAPTTISGLGDSIFIGSNAENKSQANATIDELRITGFPRSSEEIGHYFSENRSFYQNEIFLNSTDTQIKRGDNITFELTPADVSGAVGNPQNSTPLNISNSPPLPPTLNQPLNETYVSLPYTFSWNNATEYDEEDTVYYVLQIDDSLEFTEPVTYYNGSVSETTSPTSDIITNVNDGNYSWRVLSSDGTANSSFTETRAVTIDSTAPNLTLTTTVYKFLNVSSSDTEKEVTFYFNVSDSNPLTNCTFNLNETAKPTLNQTIASINQTENNFTVTLAFGGYNWTINCTDIVNNINTTEESMQVFVAYSDFEGKGRTTNFSEIDDPTNVTNLTIEEPEYGVINFTGVDLNLAEGIDIDSYISISFNEIDIDDTGVSVLNTSANLTLFNLTTTDTYVLKDSVNCTECTEIDSSSATYTFSITSGGTYTTAGVPPPPTPPTQPTGGSGGGTKALTKSKNFDFQLEKMNTDYFVIQMKQGSQRWKKIKITNTGDLTLLFELAHNLGEHLVISPEQFRLEPEDTKLIEVAFYADKPGIYTGKIIITAGEIQRIIPITLEVSSEKIVVDAKLDLLPEYLEIEQGDPLKAQITLLNTGKIGIPLVITYLIKDLEGNIVAEEIETFDISDKKAFVKTFDTSNLKAGSYVTGMNVRYGDTFSTSSARFEIKGEPVKKPIFEFKWYYAMIIISIFILIMLLKLRSTDFGKLIRKRRRQLKKHEE